MAVRGLSVLFEVLYFQELLAHAFIGLEALFTPENAIFEAPNRFWVVFDLFWSAV